VVARLKVEELMTERDDWMDITDHQNVVKYNGAADPFPNQAKHKLIVIEDLVPLINVSNIQANLNTLTQFTTRYYTSSTGADAAKWIYDKFTEYSGDSDEYNITVELFTHTWVQPSVIATIPGWGPNKNQVVVIGAHEDSVGSTTAGRAPGADDDGSGTSTVLEIFRVLAATTAFRPDRTLKFMTYAGEEAGLRGSQAVAASFAAAGTPVHAVLQLDMVGYGTDSEAIGVVGDNVDVSLSAYVKTLIGAYTELEWADTVCGYGCSDHASWTKNGYRSTFPFETAFGDHNPYIHSQNDVVSRLNWNRIEQFTRLGLGFAVELAEPVMLP
jgi:leucyl aminopeptidase